MLSSLTRPSTMKWSPASCTISMSQSIQATTSSRIGEPEPAARQLNPSNLSALLAAKALQIGS